MARPREHSSEEFRELALAAAEKLLDDQGVEALSARRIATAIGYSAASLYSVFHNLDDLCWQLNARTLERLHGALAGVVDDAPRARLHGYARVYLAFAQQQPRRWSLLFEHRAPDSLQPPAWLTGSIERLFVQLEAPLRALKPQADIDEVRLNARTLWGAVHGIAVLQQRDKLFLAGDDRAERMLPILVDQYLDGWLRQREATS